MTKGVTGMVVRWWQIRQILPKSLFSKKFVSILGNTFMSNICLTLPQVGVLLFFLYILLWLSLSHALLVPSCRFLMSADVAHGSTWSFSVLYISAVMVTCLDVYHAFLCFFVFLPTNLFFMWLFTMSRALEGLWLSLCFFRS